MPPQERPRLWLNTCLIVPRPLAAGEKASETDLEGKECSSMAEHLLGSRFNTGRLQVGLADSPVCKPGELLPVGVGSADQWFDSLNSE